MLRIAGLICAVLLLGACSTTKYERTSDLESVQTTKDIECYDWPVKENDLAIDEVFLVPGEGKSFAISQHRTRKNTRNYYALSFLDKAKTSSKELKLLKVPADETLVSLFTLGNTPLFLTEHGDAELFVREMQSTKKVAEIKLDGESLNQTIVNGKSGTWLQFQKPDDDHFYLKKFQIGSQAAPEPTAAPIVTDSRPRLIEVGSATFVMWWFKGQFLVKSMNSNKAIPVRKTGEDLESWDMTSIGNNLLLSYVEGDSAIEGNAKLHVVSLTFSPKKLATNWEKIIDIKNRHVSQPFWLKKPSLSLNISQWLDGEALLLRYSVNPKTGALKESKLGVLQPNQKVHGFVSAVKSPKTHIVTRLKTKNFWKFQACEL